MLRRWLFNLTLFQRYGLVPPATATMSTAAAARPAAT
jgi:hypothetical protein